MLLHSGKGQWYIAMHIELFTLFLAVIFSSQGVCEELTGMRCVVPEYHSPLRSISKECAPNSTVSYGTECQFDCDVDTILDGPFSLRCGANGHFDDTFPSCLRMDSFDRIHVTHAIAGEDVVLPCSISQPFGIDDILHWYKENGPFIDTLVKKDAEKTISFGSRAYEVRNGIDLFIPDVRTEDAGQFRCAVSKLNAEQLYRFRVSLTVEGRCQLPMFPHNLASNIRTCLSASVVKEGTSCVFFCKVGFLLDGTDKLQCLAAGQLSNTLPTCKEIICTVTDYPSQHITIESECHPGAKVRYNDTCTFRCPEGYFLKGKSNLTCLANGSFDSMPSCEDYDFSDVHDNWRLIVGITVPVACILVIILVTVRACHLQKIKGAGHSDGYYPVQCIDVIEWKRIVDKHFPKAIGDNVCCLIASQLEGTEREFQASIKLKVLTYIHTKMKYTVNEQSTESTNRHDIEKMIWNSKQPSSADAFAVYIWFILQSIRNEQNKQHAQLEIVALTGRTNGNNDEETHSVYSANAQEEWGALANEAFSKLLEIEHAEFPDGDEKRAWISRIFARISSYQKKMKSSANQSQSNTKENHTPTIKSGSSTSSRKYAANSFVSSCVRSLEEYQHERDRVQLRHQILVALYS